MAYFKNFFHIRYKLKMNEIFSNIVNYFTENYSIKITILIKQVMHVTPFFFPDIFTILYTKGLKNAFSFFVL